MLIRDLIEQRPADTVALLAPGRQWLTYGALLSLSDKIAGALSARGIGAGHRLAIVLPNGPEMAAAFLICANVCTTAPAGYLIVAEIPKGATGKLQCIGLAQKLGLAQ
jgi:acyl-coenzyme A synthetase/AMP-(fatty) acid ligase